MAQVVKLHPSRHADEARWVAGVAEGSRRAQNELYDYCRRYFWANYRGVFFANEESAAEIFQNAFIALWENIERRKIYAADGRLYGKDDAPFAGTLLTYFMSVARLKYLEYVRQHPELAEVDEQVAQPGHNNFDTEEFASIFYDSDDNVQLEIISDIIAHMSLRCSQILTKFYYEEKGLDIILAEIPEIGTKEALKTRKYKCMETLRESAQSIYHRYLNG